MAAELTRVSVGAWNAASGKVNHKDSRVGVFSPLFPLLSSVITDLNDILATVIE